ncbi:MAG: DUF5668 domain-containing protein [Candidatus Berkelbacteria bacterium]|nr:DUF5668 domain-containing protein [Candidatus Berkelbacteria bacterium]
MFFGLTILGIGVIFLLKNLGYISGGVWEIAWPSFLILLGLSILFRSKNRRDLFREYFTKSKK